MTYSSVKLETIHEFWSYSPQNWLKMLTKRRRIAWAKETNWILLNYDPRTTYFRLYAIIYFRLEAILSFRLQTRLKFRLQAKFNVRLEREDTYSPIGETVVNIIHIRQDEIFDYNRRSSTFAWRRYIVSFRDSYYYYSLLLLLYYSFASRRGSSTRGAIWINHSRL